LHIHGALNVVAMSEVQQQQPQRQLAIIATTTAIKTWQILYLYCVHRLANRRCILTSKKLFQTILMINQI